VADAKYLKGCDLMKLKGLLVVAFMVLLPSLHPAIIETPIYAQIVTDGDFYKDKTLRQAVGQVFVGDIVEVLEDYSGVVYRISTESSSGWIGAKFLLIEDELPTDTTILTPQQLEGFVNDGAYESRTKYLILVDINRQKTHVFQGEVGGWSLEKSFDCSTGLNTSPTTRGEFKLTERGEWFYSHRLSSGAKYWIRFNGHFLFHSTPMDEGRNLIAEENVVGEKRSSGCVRLLLPDIKWIYENVTDGTTVVII